jgi:uncharacterized protein YjiK
MKNLFYLLITLLFVNCGNRPNTSKNQQKMPFSFQFDLNKPAKTYELPPILKEISGLSFNKNNELACIQDEDGFIFFYDLDKSEIKNRVLFRKTGDYEAIEFVGDFVYILKSNGTIYEIENLGKDNQEITTYETELNKENDTEGLCYDASMNSLLIACKENAGLNGEAIKNEKSIFRFDLKTKELVKTPLLTITDDAIFQFIEQHDLKNLSFDLNEKIRFKPSGIAMKDGFYYIIASIGHMMIVVDENNNIRHIEPLDKRILPKPEGIAFDENGRLYLASEGGKGNGLIHMFE